MDRALLAMGRTWAFTLCEMEADVGFGAKEGWDLACVLIESLRLLC